MQALKDRGSAEKKKEIGIVSEAVREGVEVSNSNLLEKGLIQK